MSTYNERDALQKEINSKLKELSIGKDKSGLLYKVIDLLSAEVANALLVLPQVEQDLNLSSKDYVDAKVYTKAIGHYIAERYNVPQYFPNERSLNKKTKLLINHIDVTSRNLKF